MKKIIFNKKNLALFLLLLAIFLLGNGNIFAWIITSLVTYNVVFNNSIQTIGLFIASNKNKGIFYNLLFFSSIFVFTVLLSWFLTDREVHYHLLDTINYSRIGLQFLLLPILLSFLTKKQVPLSATFLIIPLFADSSTISSMVNKTTVSYFLSLIGSLIIYKFLYTKYKNLLVDEKSDTGKIWIVAEYVSTGILWFSWLTVSLCNFVIFLPRKFDIIDLILFSIVGIITLYCILISNGGEIQKIIDQKSDVKNIKTTVIFNSLFAFALLFIQHMDNIPITSTWMFLGILAGRELAISVTTKRLAGEKYRLCLAKIWKDLRLAIIGIVLSLLFVRIFKILFINS